MRGRLPVLLLTAVVSASHVPTLMTPLDPVPLDPRTRSPPSLLPFPGTETVRVFAPAAWRVCGSVS